MGKVQKIILGFVAGLVLFLSLSLALVIFQGGAKIRTELETVITKALGTPAQIDAVQFNPFLGKIQIPSIQLSNPQGLTSPYFMKVDGIKLVVKPQSLLQEVIQIQELGIQDWSINIEQNLSTGNVSEIASYIQKNQFGKPNSGQELKKKKVTSGSVKIDRVNTLLKISILNQNFDRSFQFDNIELKNVTSDNAVEILLDQYVLRIVAQTLGSVVKEARIEVQKNLPNLPDLPFLQNDPLKSLQELLDRVSLPTN